MDVAKQSSSWFTTYVVGAALQWPPWDTNEIATISFRPDGYPVSLPPNKVHGVYEGTWGSVGCCAVVGMRGVAGAGMIQAGILSLPPELASCFHCHRWFTS